MCALVAPSGNVEWMCLPRMDGPSVFAAALDRGAGSFRLGPADVTVPAGRRYLPGTMVLETTWATPGGWAVVRDVLLVGPWRHQSRRSDAHRRAPVDHAAERVLLRTVRCLNGFIDIALRMRARPSTTAASAAPGGTPETATARRRRCSAGRAAVPADHRPEPGIRGPAGDRPPPPAGRGAGVLRARRGATARRRRRSPRLIGGWPRPRDFWHEWISRGAFPDHPWREYLARSALTLKGLIYAPTGALMAAATTSLPETPGGERNYDYRYTWLRDSTFMLWGLYTLGFDREANDFFYFITDLAEQDADLQIMYGIGGERELTEEVLDHLSGYEGARPVRIGNGAWDQRQHDVWGVLLDSVYLHTRSRDRLDERRWPMLARQVEAAIAHWRDPDQGLWEVRGPAQHFTASKVLCWVAADRGAKLALLRGDVEQAAGWRKAADEMHADICANGTDERGVFCQHYGTTALDASALLIPLLGFLPPDDPRVRSTVLAIADELTEDGLVLRYRVEETEDGFSGEEGSFTICSFWLVSALTEIGEVDRARALCEKLLVVRQPAVPLRRGDRRALRPPAGELPAGVLAPGADQRGHAPDPRGRAPQRRRDGGRARPARGPCAGPDQQPGPGRERRRQRAGGRRRAGRVHRRPAGLRARRAGHPAREGSGRRDQPQLRAGAGADAGARGPAGARLVVLGAIRADRPGAVPDLPAVLANSERVARYAHEKKDVAGHIRRHGVDLIEHLGPVGFTGPHTMAAGDGRTWTADRIIIAVGGHAARLPIPGAELALTYEDIHSLTNLPGRVAVIGGADTGCQIASILDDFGVAVTLFKAGPTLVPVGRRGRVGRAQPRLPRPRDDGGDGYLRHRPAPGGRVGLPRPPNRPGPRPDRAPTPCSSRSAGPPASNS